MRKAETIRKVTESFHCHSYKDDVTETSFNVEETTFITPGKEFARANSIFLGHQARYCVVCIMFLLSIHALGTTRRVRHAYGGVRSCLKRSTASRDKRLFSEARNRTLNSGENYDGVSE